MLTVCKGELPNPYKNNVRKILDALICRFNDYQRINIEMRNIEDEYRNEMRDTQFRCVELQRRKIFEDHSSSSKEDDKKKNFEERIKSADEVIECFNRRMEYLKAERNETVKVAKQCLVALAKEKCRLKVFHENTIEYLKRFMQTAVDTNLIRQAEKDLCEMHILFTKEVAYIKKCEEELQPFIKQIEDCNMDYRKVCSCFKEYQYASNGAHLSSLGTVGEDIKNIAGETLIKAFAQMHIQNPADPQVYLAAFLMNFDRAEKLANEKAMLLTTEYQHDCKEPFQQTCTET